MIAGDGGKGGQPGSGGLGGHGTDGWQAPDYEMTIVAAKTPEAASPGVQVA